MKRKVSIGLIFGGLATLIAVATAWPGSATPPVGVTSVVIGTGQVTNSATIKVGSGTDVVTVQNTFALGGSSGWHSHPGPTVVTIVSGQLTLYSENASGGACHVRTFTAGQTFYEWPKNAQNGVNSGDTDTVAAVTFFNVPHGAPARIDMPDPGNCPG